MQKMMMKFLINQVTKETGKQGLTREYLFDHSYAEHRSSAILGGDQRLTTLSFLLRNLNELERENLFPGQFDLGNSKPPLKLTTAALIKEIWDEGHCDANESIRITKEGIKGLTGISFSTFFKQDKFGALKVLKLLHLMKTKNPVRFISLLKPLGEDSKFSMEVRDAYPLKGNENSGRFISDLKAFLTLEIAPCKLAEIDVAFDQLPDVINDITQEMIESAVSASGGNYNALLHHLDILVNHLAILKSEEVPKPSMPLAETLYIHCCAVEFIHLSKAHRFISTNLMPKISIRAIGSELRQMSRTIQGRQQVSMNTPCVPMSDFMGFVHRHEQEIGSALTKSTDDQIVPIDIRTAAPHAEKLLRLWAAFNHPRQVLTLVDDFEVSPLMAVAALAAICFELAHPTSFYPYWLGQKFDRGNVLSALEKVDLHSSKTNVAEEHNVYWTSRLQWFQYAIAGQLDFLERKLKVGECLMISFEKPAQSYNIASIQEKLDGCTWLSNQLSNLFR